MKTTLVSIIIPTYKRATMLHRAILSTLEQTYKNIEVLVVSDNEPDDEFTVKARETVESFNDSRVRLITQEKHIMVQLLEMSVSMNLRVNLFHFLMMMIFMIGTR